jgi:hypothetical protein
MMSVKASHRFRYRPTRIEEVAPGFEIGLVFEDVPRAFERAVTAGASVLSSPGIKPWGQVVAYVRDQNGFIIELCTSMGVSGQGVRRRGEPFRLALCYLKFWVDILGEKSCRPEWNGFEIRGSLQTKIAEISHLKWHHRSINDAIHSNI